MLLQQLDLEAHLFAGQPYRGEIPRDTPLQNGPVAVMLHRAVNYGLASQDLEDSNPTTDAIDRTMAGLREAAEIGLLTSVGPGWYELPTYNQIMFTFVPTGMSDQGNLEDGEEYHHKYVIRITDKGTGNSREVPVYDY